MKTVVLLPNQLNLFCRRSLFSLCFFIFFILWNNLLLAEKELVEAAVLPRSVSSNKLGGNKLGGNKLGGNKLISNENKIISQYGSIRPDNQQVGKQVSLRVRTINAFNSEGLETLEHSEQDIDMRLKDLRDKFSSLPYNKFTLRSSEKVDVALRRKSSVRLPDGHVLTFRVLYRNDKRIGLWLDWLDNMGMMILNSKVHLNCTEPFLVGTDHVKGGGLLLAVAAED